MSSECWTRLPLFFMCEGREGRGRVLVGWGRARVFVVPEGEGVNDPIVGKIPLTDFCGRIFKEL